MMKRLIDLGLAACGLALLLPLFVPLALLIKFYDGGPVFFVQRRIGRGARPFTMFKFRTMKPQAEAGEILLTVGRDARITPMGHFMRRYKLDELPQLFNVLANKMSLVGPRPEVAKFVEAYSPAQRAVLALKPGVTDPASFAFFDESELLSRKADPERFYRDVLMGEKIRINLEYAAKATAFTDVVLIFATVGRVLGLKPDIFAWLKIALPKAQVREEP